MALTWLRKGIDYDLVNISVIGFDPVTGRSFQECHAEWRRELDAVQARIEKMRWWNLLEQFRTRRDLLILNQRQGMGSTL